MQLGRYKLGDLIAAGGMGEVYRASIQGAEGFEKPLAIKRIYPELANSKRSREQFVREANLLSGLVHPNIVQVYELGGGEGELYIAMELVEGCTADALLAHAMEIGRPLPPPIVAVLAFDVLNALDTAHTKRDSAGELLGIVHRDVTPHNILLSHDGVAKLCDFGIARVAEGTGTVAGKIQGKVPYVAPELLMGQTADVRCDLFSAGVILYELLAGHILFADSKPAEQLRLLMNQVTNPMDLRPLARIPERLQHVLRRALEFDPDSRYLSAAQFRDDLNEYLVRAGPAEAREALAGLIRKLTEGKKTHQTDSRRRRSEEPTQIQPRPKGLSATSTSVETLVQISELAVTKVDNPVVTASDEWTAVLSRAELLALKERSANAALEHDTAVQPMLNDEPEVTARDVALSAALAFSMDDETTTETAFDFDDDDEAFTPEFSDPALNQPFVPSADTHEYAAPSAAELAGTVDPVTGPNAFHFREVTAPDNVRRNTTERSRWPWVLLFLTAVAIGLGLATSGILPGPAP